MGGFVNPHFKPCPRAVENDCHGGTTSAGMWLDNIARMIAMIGDHVDESPRADALRARGIRWPHPYLVESAFSPAVRLPAGLKPYTRLLPFTAELGQLVDGLTGPQGSKASIIGRDAYPIVKALRRAAGVDESWGPCPVCAGEGIDPAAKAAYDAWEKVFPPSGEGWQLWETVTEGSPISKVYPTREAFVAYLVEDGYSRTAAERFCDTGYVPTGLVTGEGVKMNIEMLDEAGEGLNEAKRAEG